ncbi:MAG TPA: 50S ribosomal protein L15 [Clostridia bacterium]|nr:50S ribosomal protein L15 [Clostridia bacterium]
MNIQDLKGAEGATTTSKRIGRGIGSGMGKQSTRGAKGQWARSGGGVRPNFEGGQMPMTRRIPKRGFNNKRFAHIYSSVNIEALNCLENDTVVNAEKLLECGILSKVEPFGLKIMGGGELNKKLIVQAQKFTKSAVEAIEKAGGKAEVL